MKELIKVLKIWKMKIKIWLNSDIKGFFTPSKYFGGRNSFAKKYIIINLLSYVSKINKNKKLNKKLFSELMKNIKIKYEEDKINYEEYYFNGVPIPKNIQFKDITSSSLNICWDIDNNFIINEKIKYRIEMRKENKEFKKIYEGNNNYNTTLR